MYLQAYEKSSDTKLSDRFLPIDILEDDKECEAIQIQIIVGKDDDIQFPLCFSTGGQASKYKYARLRFINDGSVEFFHPQSWKYYTSKMLDGADLRNVLLRIFESFDPKNLEDEDLEIDERW